MVINPRRWRGAAAAGMWTFLLVSLGGPAPVLADPIVIRSIPAADFVPLSLPNVEPGQTATRTGSINGLTHLGDVYAFTVSTRGTYVFDIDTESLDESLRGDLFLSLWVDVTRPQSSVFCDPDCPMDPLGLFPVAWSDDSGFDAGSDSSVVDPYLGTIALSPIVSFYCKHTADDQVCDSFDWPLTYYVMVSPALVFPNFVSAPNGDPRELTRPDGEAGGVTGEFRFLAGGNPIPSTYPQSTFGDVFAPYIGQPGTAGDYTLYVTRLNDPEPPKPPGPGVPEPATLALMATGIGLTVFRRVARARRQEKTRES